MRDRYTGPTGRGARGCGRPRPPRCMREPSAIPPKVIEAVTCYPSRASGASAGLLRLASGFELRELSHERRGDIGVDLAIEKNGAFRLAQHRSEGAQFVQGADGVRLKPEGLRHRREIHVRKH